MGEPAITATTTTAVQVEPLHAARRALAQRARVDQPGRLCAPAWTRPVQPE
jgi:hypothetical protein